MVDEVLTSQNPSKKYTQLPAATLPLTSSEIIALVQGGVSKQATVSNIRGTAAGTVTSVSIASANGLAGSVANATTTPAITLSTTITGLFKGNGTAISAAVSNTDYQSPIALTTTGTSGAATFNGTTLNIPQYTAGGGSGTVTTVSVVTANGVSGSVANATTTPAITITLGAITPSTVNGLTLAALATGFTIAGGTTSKTLTVPSDATVSGTNTGDQSSVTGNAGTATALQNARTIGGVSFNGTANIVPQTIQSVNEASDTTCFPLFISASGSQSLQPLNNINLTFNASTGALGASNLSGTNTGDQTSVSGNAGTATALATGRTISISGDLTYTSPSFDGTSNITAAGTLKNTGTAGTYGQVTTDAQGRVTSGISANDVTHGGTGVATITGLIKGNGTSAFTAATAGTDYPGLATANTYTTGIQYLNGATIEEAVFSNGNSGTSKAINLDNGNLQSITITGNVAITQTTPTHPGKYTLIVTIDGTGSRTYSLTGVKFPGGTAPTYSTAANKVDVISIIWDGTNYLGMGGIAFS